MGGVDMEIYNFLASGIGFTLALLCVLAIASAPVVMIWLALSVRRSLLRVADALESDTKHEARTWQTVALDKIQNERAARRDVSNSALGR
jgi:hypothetical protein